MGTTTHVTVSARIRMAQIARALPLRLTVQHFQLSTAAPVCVAWPPGCDLTPCPPLFASPSVASFWVVRLGPHTNIIWCRCTGTAVKTTRSTTTITTSTTTTTTASPDTTTDPFEAAAEWATVLGGYKSTAGGMYSFVGGGSSNKAKGTLSAIAVRTCCRPPESSPLVTADLCGSRACCGCAGRLHARGERNRNCGCVRNTFLPGSKSKASNKSRSFFYAFD